MNYKLAHVCLGSPDLAASERFYCDLLGMKRGFQFLKEGRLIGFYVNVGEGTFIEIFATDQTTFSTAHPLRHFCLETDDIDAVRARLIEGGHEPTEKKLGADRSWQIWVESPEGLRFEFHQYTSESSQRTGTDCVVDW